MYTRRIILGCLGLLALSAMGCQTNPETGRSQFIVLNEPKEIELGEQAAPKFLKSYGGQIESQIDSREIRDYVSAIGMQLARSSSRPLLPWEFFVVDSQVINAFALPGGKVFISRGLLAKLDNEAQLAGVLGHEIGHVTAKHVNDRMVGQKALGIGLIAAGLATQFSDEDYLKVLGVGVGAGGAFYMLSYGRGQELESDRIGVKYMARNGYNPWGQVQLMRVLRQESSGRSGQLELLSTHPLPKSRIKALKKHIRKTYSDAKSNERYGYYAERFKKSVLDKLAQLPPPKHTGEK